MNSKREKIIQTAAKYVQKGAYAKAIKEYEALLHADPSDQRTWLKIGELYEKLGDKNQAVNAYFKIAQYYDEHGWFDKANAIYALILRLDTQRNDVYEKMGENAMRSNRVNDALRNFSIAAEQTKNDNPVKAMELYRRVLVLDPAQVGAQINLAELCSSQGDVKQAVEHFSRAAHLLKVNERTEDYIKVAERLIFHQPENLEVTKDLARIYLNMGKTKRALSKLQICFKSYSRDPETLLLLANAFEILEQPVKTVSVLRELLKVYRENDNFEQGRVIADRILELSPGDVDAEQFLNEARLQSGESFGDDDLGDVVQGKPIEDDSDEEAIDALMTEVDVFIGYGLVDQAIENISKVLSLEPDHEHALSALKDIHVKRGDEPQAIRVLLTLGTIHLKANPAAAVRDFAQVLEIDPDNGQARELLRQAQSFAQKPESEREPSASEVVELDMSDLVDLESDSDLFDASAPIDGSAEEASRVAVLNLDEAVEEASFFMVQGLYDEAKTILEDLALQYPRNQEVMQKLSELRDILGDEATGAAGIINVARDLDVELDGQRDTGQAGAFSLEEVSRTYDVQNLTSGERTHLELGSEYLELGLVEQARREYQWVLDNPRQHSTTELARVLFELSGILEINGEADEARAKYQQALRLDPALEGEQRRALQFEQQLSSE